MNGIATCDARARNTVSAFADDAGGERATGINGCGASHFVLQRFSHVDHTAKAIVGIENSSTARLADCDRLSPVHLDPLPVVALDERNPHPDARGSMDCIPVLDLVVKRSIFGVAKTQVFSARLCLRKVEGAAVETDE